MRTSQVIGLVFRWPPEFDGGPVSFLAMPACEPGQVRKEAAAAGGAGAGTSLVGPPPIPLDSFDSTYVFPHRSRNLVVKFVHDQFRQAMISRRIENSQLIIRQFIFVFFNNALERVY